MENKMQKRLSKLRKTLKAKEIDAILIIQPENIRYFSNFTGSSGHLLITANTNYLITDFRYVEQAKSQAPDFEVVKYERKLVDTLKELALSQNIKHLGFEEDYMVFKTYESYYQNLKPIKFVPAAQIMADLRVIKDDFELEQLKKSAQLADEAFSHIISMIKPGVKEIDIAVELEFYFRKKGATAKSFDFIVASGKRGALPHGVASDKEILSGELVTLDFGCIYNGYCSDITRTVGVGSIDSKQRKIYDIVLKAQIAGLEGLKAGITCDEADRNAREVIKKAGYGDYFGHSLGHGVGLEIHEEPRLVYDNSMLLKAGMVVTVEPGIYIPDWGGVRIEDMVVINKNKIEILTKTCKELLVL